MNLNFNGNGEMCEILNCYNIGIVEKYGVVLGNIVGGAYTGAVVKNSYFSRGICDMNGAGSINNAVEVEIIEKSISYMKTNSFVNDLNKDEDVFVMDTGINNGYPILKWQIDY